MKQCSKCMTEQPEDQFRRGKVCRSCEKKASAAYRLTQGYQQARARYKQTDKYKQTERRREEKPETRATRSKYACSERGKANQKRYCSTEKGKLSAAKRTRKYRQTEKGKESAKRNDQKRAQKASRREKLRAAWRAYHKTPKGKYRNKIRQYLRRQRMYISPEKRLTFEQWESVKAIQKGRCYWCKKKAKLTQDHVIPLSKGGAHTKTNIVGACLQCNQKKGAKIVTLF